MNIPPETDLRVPAGELRPFVSALGAAAGLADDRAALLAELLVGNDLRGVFSHGSVQIATYARLLRDGQLNPHAEPTVVREGPTSLLVDGDGGLGYFAAHDGTALLIERAQQSGIAALLTRQHGHFGAAGLYARQTLDHDLLTFVTSGHQLRLQPGQPIHAAAGGSPMAFSAPTLHEDPVVLDFGTMHDLYEGSRRDEIAEIAPGLVLRSIGMGTICQAWGGLLAGVPLDPARAERRWPGANQGSLVIAMRIDLFCDPEDFKAEMDAYVRAVHTLHPLDGTDPLLPGGPEAIRERAWTVTGIPVGEAHRTALERVGEEFGVTAPWS